MTVFAKGTTWGQISILSFVYGEKVHTLHELFIALYCTLLAGSVFEIRLRKVWNYKKCAIKRIVFKHLLSIKATTFHILPCHGTPG